MSVLLEKDTLFLPAEVLGDIVACVADPLTLFTLLRVSKLLCQLAAPHLYRHIIVTPQVDLLFDTGLPADALTRSSHIGSNSNPAADRLLPADAFAEHATLKRFFLSLIRTVDLKSGPTSTHTPGDFILSSGAKRGLARSRYARTMGRTAVGKWLENLPRPIVPCEVLSIFLRQDTFERHSPLQPESHVSREVPLFHFLASLLPRRLVILGAGIYQTSNPVEGLPRNIFTCVRDVLVTLSPESPPRLSEVPHFSNTGIAYILDCIACDFELVAARPDNINTSGHPLVDITLILTTPNSQPRFPPLDPIPRLAVYPRYADDKPYRAQGWLHAMNVRIAYQMVDYRSAYRARSGEIPLPSYWQAVAGARTLGTFRKVNFGSFDGDQVDLPDSTIEELQEIIERGLRWQIRKLTAMRGEKPDREEAWLRFMGMKEWIEEEKSKGELAVLDESIEQGWTA